MTSGGHFQLSSALHTAVRPASRLGLALAPVTTLARPATAHPGPALPCPACLRPCFGHPGESQVRFPEQCKQRRSGIMTLSLLGGLVPSYNNNTPCVRHSTKRQKLNISGRQRYSIARVAISSGLIKYNVLDVTSCPHGSDKSYCHLVSGGRDKQSKQ